MSGTQAIPASAIVSIIPGVLAAGGRAQELSGLFLTPNPRVPIGTVQQLGSQQSVSDYFGPAAVETTIAAPVYFAGYSGATQRPAEMLFAQYNQTNVGAYLRGAPLTLSLAQLQAITSGNITFTIDGTPETATGVNLSTATSFSAAAELLATAIGIAGPAGASFTGVIATTVLTASAVTGTINVGAEVLGAGVPANTQIASYGTGTGGAGTYNLTTSSSVSSEAMTTDTPVCTYDSISGAFQINSPTTGTSSTVSFGSSSPGNLATTLGFTQATGAVRSPGAVAATPAAFMNAIVALNRNWATFTTIVDPDAIATTGNTVKQAFAAWSNGEEEQYLYVVWDTDASPTTANPATSSLGHILEAADSSGTLPVWAPSATEGLRKAAFAMTWAASLDFSATNGRATLKFRHQTGLTADVTSLTVAQNLEGNSYNYYGAWSTANDEFLFMSPGSVVGPWDWADTFVDQIWLNNQFQLAILLFLTQIGSIPYNQAGYSLLRAAMADVVIQAENFGVFRAGVTLSQAQIAEVNDAAGLDVAGTLQTQGWYLLIQDASPEVRQARGSPPMTFWYTDGESIQQIRLASVVVQ